MIQKSVCIICEGFEEYDYLSKLIELKVWNNKYRIELKNVEGNGNLSARYNYLYQMDIYDIILILCDTERKPYKQYYELKNKIDAFHGVKGISDLIVFFTNPCSLQLMIYHFSNDILPSNNKSKCKPIVEKNTGIKNYSAHDRQRQVIASLITCDNYYEMKKTIKNIVINEKVKGSTNFYTLISYLESSNTSWINKINKKL